MNRGILAHHVNHDQHSGNAVNRPQAAQPQVQPLDFTLDQQSFLLRQLIDLAARNQLFKPIELADPGRNRVPVRQRTAQPAFFWFC